MKKTYRIKTNNQELLIRKQNESDATSRWIEFQKTRPWREISSWRKKEEREDLKKLELKKKAQILREVNHAFKKSKRRKKNSESLYLAFTKAFIYLLIYIFGLKKKKKNKNRKIICPKMNSPNYKWSILMLFLIYFQDPIFWKIRKPKCF